MSLSKIKDIGKLERYSIEGIPLAIIINVHKFYDINDDKKEKSSRKGSDKSAKKMKETFEKIGFQTELHCNSLGEMSSLSQAKIHGIVEGFLTRLRKMHGKAKDERCSMVAIVISSHGGPDRFEIDCADGVKFNVEKDLFQKFENEALLCMVGKPKVFILQFCRGSEYNKAIPVPNPKPDTDGNFLKVKKQERVVVQSLSDAIIAYSTSPGKVAFRNFFFDAIIEVFKKNGSTDEVIRLFKMVSAEVNKKEGTDNKKPAKAAKQAIAVDLINLSKDIYFPGEQARQPKRKQEDKMNNKNTITKRQRKK